MKKIGFIGLGNMGSKMVQNLLKANYEVVGYDTNPEAINILNRNGIIAIFPAGSVAWSRKRGAPIQEEYWKAMLGKLLNSSNFERSNSTSIFLGVCPSI